MLSVIMLNVVMLNVVAHLYVNNQRKIIVTIFVNTIHKKNIFSGGGWGRWGWGEKELKKRSLPRIGSSFKKGVALSTSSRKAALDLTSSRCTALHFTVGETR